MATKSITIKYKNEKDLIPVAMFVQTASKFKSKILVNAGNKTVNAKSIMGVMALDFVPGTTMELQADGEDAEDALDGISALLCN